MSNEQVMERAGAQVRALAEGAGIRPIAMAVDLTDIGRQLLPSMLSHQLAADHAVKMRLVARLDQILARLTADRPEAEQARDGRELAQLCAAAARFTERYRQGLMSLARLQRWPGMAPAPRDRPAKADDSDDDPLDDGPGGGPGGGKSMSRLFSELQAMNKAAEAMLKNAPANGHDAASGRAPAPLANRGRLRHGNPSGDFLAAPRCGACTRAGSACRQPAMANGRCRLHGGKSTGARTAAGLARCRAARLVHGHRTAEIIDLKSALARRGRRLAALTRLAKSSKPESERPTPCPATREVVHAETRRHGAPRRFPSSAFSAAPRANPQSERPTPCPARNSRRRRAAGG